MLEMAERCLDRRPSPHTHQGCRAGPVLKARIGAITGQERGAQALAHRRRRRSAWHGAAGPLTPWAAPAASFRPRPTPCVAPARRRPQSRVCQRHCPRARAHGTVRGIH